MFKDMSYKDKFILLEPFLLYLFSSVKKDLKKEHFKADPTFYHNFFRGKLKAKITLDELKSVYTEQVVQGNEELGSYIANRFVNKKMELYHFFAQHLALLNPDFEEIESIPTELAEKWADDALSKFLPKDIYLFVILNSVVFPESTLKRILDSAEKDE